MTRAERTTVVFGPARHCAALMLAACLLAPPAAWAQDTGDGEKAKPPAGVTINFDALDKQQKKPATPVPGQRRFPIPPRMSPLVLDDPVTPRTRLAKPRAKPDIVAPVTAETTAPATAAEAATPAPLPAPEPSAPAPAPQQAAAPASVAPTAPAEPGVDRMSFSPSMPRTALVTPREKPGSDTPALHGSVAIAPPAATETAPAALPVTAPANPGGNNQFTGSAKTQAPETSLAETAADTRFALPEIDTALSNQVSTPLKPLDTAPTPPPSPPLPSPPLPSQPAAAAPKAPAPSPVATAPAPTPATAPAATEGPKAAPTDPVTIAALPTAQDAAELAGETAAAKNPSGLSPLAAAQAGNSVIARLRFAPGLTDLRPEAVSAIQTLGQKLSPLTMRVQIIALSGRAGDESSGARRLSLMRALVVRNNLMARGIDKSRILISAFGGAPDGNTDRVDVLVRKDQLAQIMGQ